MRKMSLCGLSINKEHGGLISAGYLSLFIPAYTSIFYTEFENSNDITHMQ